MELEIAVQDVVGAEIAIARGADRVELCQALGLGGLTPSLGLIERASEAVGPERIAVLVRCRGGGFVYDREELEVMVSDVAEASRRGVGAVVLGALTASGDIDREAVRRLRDAAGETLMVFHRAIDTLPEPVRVIEELVDLGLHRVLTSGGRATCRDGAAAIGAMVARASGRLEIMAGGGLVAEDIPPLHRAGVTAVHLSARGTGTRRGASGPGGGEELVDQTDPVIVEEARRVLDAAARSGR